MCAHPSVIPLAASALSASPPTANALPVQKNYPDALLAQHPTAETRSGLTAPPSHLQALHTPAPHTQILPAQAEPCGPASRSASMAVPQDAHTPRLPYNREAIPINETSVFQPRSPHRSHNRPRDAYPQERPPALRQQPPVCLHARKDGPRSPQAQSENP